jgi:3-methyl-2-oxobutanoate hydroxymethyltransferase
MTVPALRAMKARGERITMITAYDATFARMLDEGGADALLVGDSLGMVVQGLDSTLPVTVDEVVYHCRAVARGTQHAHIVGDMPFMSYQGSMDEALRNAGRFLKEGGAHAVKLEGGAEIADKIARIVAAGIPVMGHVGLTPQSVHAFGGFKVQGRGEGAEKVIADAIALEQAGAYAVVLEAIPPDVAEQLTQLLSIPTIGIGAGPSCDGQVLVYTDLLGLARGHRPKFAKQFAQLGDAVVEAFGAYIAEVRAGTFPSAAHSYKANGAPAGSAAASAVPASGPTLIAPHEELDAPLALDLWH